MWSRPMKRMKANKAGKGTLLLSCFDKDKNLISDNSVNAVSFVWIGLFYLSVQRNVPALTFKVAL